MSSDFEANDLVIVQHYFEIGQYEKAGEYMQKFLQSSPENPDYLLLMAKIQFNLGNLNWQSNFAWNQ